MGKLISIITPTYNCGHLIHRLLDSILQQTYNNIEMFVIDDGSTDDTKQTIKNYSKKFEEKKIAFKYIYQENQGQSAAINTGLKFIHGDYLTWPDADDFYAEANALEILAATLDNTMNDIGCCRALSYYVDENLNIIDKTHVKNIMLQSLFEDCLFDKNGFFWGAGNYMIKTEPFFNEINGRNIYAEKSAGQNWQMLLPILYNRKCITINNYIFKILERINSHSRTNLTYEKQINKCNVFQNVRINTINNIESIPKEKKTCFIYEINKSCTLQLFMIYFTFGKVKEAIEMYRQMREANMLIPLRIKLRYAVCLVPFGFALRKIWRKLLGRK